MWIVKELNRVLKSKGAIARDYYIDVYDHAHDADADYI